MKKKEQSRRKFLSDVTLGTIGTLGAAGLIASCSGPGAVSRQYESDTPDISPFSP